VAAFARNRWPESAEYAGLRQKDLAAMFGVSAPVVSYWLKGMDQGEDGKILGKPIPADVAPLVVRWVETGSSPTAEELAVLSTRREKKRGGPGRPPKRN